MELKKTTTEKEENPHIPKIRDFIIAETKRQQTVSTLYPDDHNHDIETLNRLFLEILN